MRFEGTVGLDHPLKVLVAPMRNRRATATGGQPVHNTLGPCPVGCQGRLVFDGIAAGVAHRLGHVDASRDEDGNLEHHCEGRQVGGMLQTDLS